MTRILAYIGYTRYLRIQRISCDILYKEHIQV